MEAFKEWVAKADECLASNGGRKWMVPRCFLVSVTLRNTLTTCDMQCFNIGQTHICTDSHSAVIHVSVSVAAWHFLLSYSDESLLIQEAVGWMEVGKLCVRSARNIQVYMQTKFMYKQKRGHLCFCGGFGGFLLVCSRVENGSSQAQVGCRRLPRMHAGTTEPSWASSQCPPCRLGLPPLPWVILEKRPLLNPLLPIVLPFQCMALLKEREDDKTALPCC